VRRTQEIATFPADDHGRGRGSGRLDRGQRKAPDHHLRHPRPRRYLRAFSAAAEKTATALDLYNTVVDEYPDRLNRGVLWNSARAVKS